MNIIEQRCSKMSDAQLMKFRHYLELQIYDIDSRKDHELKWWVDLVLNPNLVACKQEIENRKSTVKFFNPGDEGDVPNVG